MPALRDLLAARRSPEAELAVQLAMAEADLTGLAARLAAGHLYLGSPDPVATIRRVVGRVFDLREQLDALRLAALPFDSICGVPLSGNDSEDMKEALLHALQRLQAGIDEPAAFREQPASERPFGEAPNT